MKKVFILRQIWDYHEYLIRTLSGIKHINLSCKSVETEIPSQETQHQYLPVLGFLLHSLEICSRMRVFEDKWVWWWDWLAGCLSRAMGWPCPSPTGSSPGLHSAQLPEVCSVLPHSTRRHPSIAASSEAPSGWVSDGKHQPSNEQMLVVAPGSELFPSFTPILYCSVLVVWGLQPWRGCSQVLITAA